jgi:hypothetical protein
MIIFGFVLTTFELSSILGGSWGSRENWLEPKIEPPLGNLACPNLLNALYNTYVQFRYQFLTNLSLKKHLCAIQSLIFFAISIFVVLN